MSQTPELNLNDRARHLLKALVEDYIRTGQPVGSRNLARSSGLSVSPATVRNVMADLEEMGLIYSPHTSAGRIPTALGYRVFVDSLISLRPLDPVEVERLRLDIDPEGGKDAQQLAETVSSMLSSLAHMAGVVMLPRPERVRLRQIEFLRLEGGRVLVILVTSTGEIHNRLITPRKAYGAEDLTRIANYLNERYAGMELHQIHDALLAEMKQVQRDMYEVMQLAIELGEQVFAADGEEDLVLSGETQLMEYEDLSDLEQLRQLFEAFHQKRDVLSILDQCIHAEGLKIFIGSETGHEVFSDCSIVSAPYQMEGETVGVLGVIGPMRMAYDRVIPMVDITARALTAALNSRG